MPIRIKFKQPVVYGHVNRVVGESVLAPERDARLLMTVGVAEEDHDADVAVDDVGADELTERLAPKKEAKRKRKRKYQRRDMVPE